MVCLGRPYNFKVFKGCLPQILLCSLLNTLAHLLWNTTGKHQIGAKLFNPANRRFNLNIHLPVR